jgi:hypothetical protein
VAQPALTDTEKVRAYIGKKGPEDDTILNDFIASASSMIRDHTGRRFSSPAEIETRELAVRGAADRIYIDEVFTAAQILSVTGLDLASISYYTMSTDLSIKKGRWLYMGGPGLLPSTVYPPDHADLFIREYSGGPPTEYFAPVALLVTAEFGWDEIPPDIEFMARACVKYWYESQVAHFGRQFDAAEGRVIFPEHLPSIVLKGLEPWVHPEKFAFV